MTPSFMIKNFRYAILVIFILAAIVTPTPDVVNMCIFASPMLLLYALSIGVAYVVHPAQREARKQKQSQGRDEIDSVDIAGIVRDHGWRHGNEKAPADQRRPNLPRLRP